MFFHNEDELIRKVQAGDQESFRPLYHNYIKPIYRFIWSQVSHKEEAEDLTSQTFFKAYQAINNFRFEAKFQSWLYTIARYTINDYWREKYARGVEIPFEDYLTQELPNAEDYIDSSSKTEKFAQSILKLLPKNYRDILHYRFLKNYSIKETAEVLAISTENVKVLQHRALKKAAQLSPLPTNS